MKQQDTARVFGRLMALEMMATSFLAMTLGGGTADPLTALKEMQETMLPNRSGIKRAPASFEGRCWQEAAVALEHLFDHTRERLLELGFDQ